MTTLILIVQTLTGAMAYEYGPFPDATTCEKSAIRHIQEIESNGSVLKVVSDCRLIYPELYRHTADNNDLE